MISHCLSEKTAQEEDLKPNIIEELPDLIITQTDLVHGDDLLIVRIGSDQRPASQLDLKDIEERVKDLSTDMKKNVVVTHHCFDIEVINVPDCRNMLIFKLGTDNRPASAMDIEHLQGLLDRRQKNPKLNCIISHHALDVIVM